MKYILTCILPSHTRRQRLSSLLSPNSLPLPTQGPHHTHHTPSKRRPPLHLPILRIPLLILPQRILIQLSSPRRSLLTLLVPMVLVLMPMMRTMRPLSRRRVVLPAPAVGLLLLRDSDGRCPAELRELRTTALRHGGGAAVVLDGVCGEAARGGGVEGVLGCGSG